MKRVPKVRLVTAESVRAGHPDKFCDQLADRILDAHLKKDPRARVAVEVMATDGKLLIAGEVTSNAEVDYAQIARELICQIGYDQSDLNSGTGCEPEIEIRIHEQSPDISQAVGFDDEVGAGDQGIMVGYATDETPEYMPLPVVLAHSICRQMDVLMKSYPWMGADGKAQVTVAYEEQKPVVIDTVIVSVQHHSHTERTEIENVIEEMLKSVLPADLCGIDTKLLINPSGQFALGGPAADTGLTGRKLAVDQYGPVARLGGGALSGKDPTKVDRSGAYAARWIARNYCSKTHAAEPYLFTGVLKCANCWASYRRKVNHRGTSYEKVIWVCATYTMRGKAACPSKVVPDEVLMRKTAEVLEADGVDREMLLDAVERIEVGEDNRLTYVFWTGERKTVVWEDASRRDSWTDEMKKIAADRQRRRCAG